jgi:hypothetical protein
MDVGETVSVAAVPPELHAYVEAPDAVSTSLLPEQTVDDAALAVTVGSGFTITLTVAVFTQPFASVPVTVSVVIVVGETVSVAAVPPELHAYVEAPDAVSTSLLPVQIAEEAAVAVTVGSGLIVNEKVAGALLPHALSAVTVMFPLVEPGCMVMLVVPCPPVMLEPDGTAHV